MTLRTLLSSICLQGLLLTSVLAPLEAQSRSQAEEALRSELLQALHSGKVKSADDLKHFYRRPAEIPFRPQPGVVREAAIKLGEKLFYDPRLSRAGDMSCSSCHVPSKHWVDGLAKSIEGNSRRSMALFNLAWDSCFTWHCRAGSLMSQSVMAMTAPKGMAAHLLQSAEGIAKIPEYPELFKKAFPLAKKPVLPETIAAAIEHYVSTITSAPAPFDRWVEGDEKALSESQKRGFVKFHIKAPCAECHNLWRFSDSRRYDIGLADIGKDGQSLYKAVGLRDIAERPPYMHDGSLPTLIEVLAFYVRGGDAARPSKSALIKPLRLDLTDQADIILFLQSLTSEEKNLQTSSKSPASR